MHTAEKISFQEPSPLFYDRKKITVSEQAVLWNIVSEQPDLPSSHVLKKAVEITGKIDITVRHLNRIRAKWGLSRKKGRPSTPAPRSIDCNSVIKVVPDLASTGVHLFAEWMESLDSFSIVLRQLRQNIELWHSKNPDKMFPLLCHRDETLLRHYRAFFYAPLLGIKKLTEFDYKEHCLPTLIGRGYQSSTLTQSLGELERINAGEHLRKILFPEQAAHRCYIDGHMIAFWSSTPMHKGKITMLGRIMAGSQAMVAHDEHGRVIYVEYYPPDIRMPGIILSYCEQIVQNTGTNVFIIDREINSEALAAEFESRKWGLLSMLDSNQYKDLSDWDHSCVGKVDSFGKIYTGQWRDEKRRNQDPRYFVIAENDGKLLPYWGTSVIKDCYAPLKWPGLYADRNEIQENGFKRMKRHGALEVNYGIKKITGPDRHHERKVEKLEDRRQKMDSKVEKKEEKINGQLAKIKESEEQGHGKRLEQRQNRLVIMEKDLDECKKNTEKIMGDIEAVGTVGERSDRDFRKQLIMTVRTCHLENSLMMFLSLLIELSGIKTGIDNLIEMLFERTGMYMETSSEITYWVNLKGVSVPYKNKIIKLAEAYNLMELSRGGKPVQLKVRGVP